MPNQQNDRFLIGITDLSGSGLTQTVVFVKLRQYFCAHVTTTMLTSSSGFEERGQSIASETMMLRLKENLI